MAWPHLHQLITLCIIELVMLAGCRRLLLPRHLLRLIVAMPLSWGIGMRAELQAHMQTGHMFMIVAVSTAVLITMRSTELGLMAQAISKSVVCPISHLRSLHLPLLLFPRSHPVWIHMTAGRCLQLHQSLHTTHRNTTQSDEYRLSQRPTTTNESGCLQFLLPQAPTLFHSQKNIMHSDMRLTKALVPRYWLK